LLTLDVVDFRQLLGRQPDLARVVSEEAERRLQVQPAGRQSREALVDPDE
jgi:hypothetical protein